MLVFTMLHISVSNPLIGKKDRKQIRNRGYVLWQCINELVSWEEFFPSPSSSEDNRW